MDINIVAPAIVTAAGLLLAAKAVLSEELPLTQAAIGITVAILGMVWGISGHSVNRANDEVDIYKAAASQRLIVDKVDGDRVDIRGTGDCTIQAKRLDGKIIFEGVNLSKDDTQPLTPKMVAALCRSTALAAD